MFPSFDKSKVHWLFETNKYILIYYCNSDAKSLKHTTIKTINLYIRCMIQAKIIDNQIYALFSIEDITRITVYRQGDIKQVFILTTNGARFEADKEFYIYVLQRMTECKHFPTIECMPWVGKIY